MKIIFMGTPLFSCPTLEKLLSDSEFEVVAVYTREPQIAGRGQKLTNSPIQELALKHGLKVITPKTLRDQKTQEEFLKFEADAAVVVAYGLILPQEILDGTKLGCINIHPSLLPRWRGAAPIQRPLMAGDSETGMTIIKMDKGIDSGDIISQRTLPLNGDETYKTLADTLSHLGAEMLIESLKKLSRKEAILTKQNHDLATYAKKIEKSECEINWQESAQQIKRKICALNGCGEAFFIHNNEKIKIFSAEILDEKCNKNKPGKILDDRLSIQCGEGIIRPTILQRQGKKPMPLSEFLLGFLFH